MSQGVVKVIAQGPMGPIGADSGSTIPVLRGGTGATTAAGARTNLGVDPAGTAAGAVAAHAAGIDVHAITSITGLAAALALLAPLESPAFTGTPTVPTAVSGTNTTQIASTQFVTTAVANGIAGLVNSSPAALDTLNELAAALDNDPNFASTISASLGNRLRIDAAQGLSAPQQAQGRDNLGLGAAALAATTDGITEGSTNLWYTDARVRAATLTGLGAGSDTPIQATDGLLAALALLQAQVSARQATLVSGSNIKSVNGQSLLGSGDLTVGGASPGGSGTELQYRSGASSFGAVAGSSVSGSSVTLGGETVTASKPVLNLSQTWNNAAVTFTGFRFDITNTASSSTSLLLDFRLGGSSVFSVNRAGRVQTAMVGSSVTSSFSGILFSEAAHVHYASNQIQFHVNEGSISVGGGNDTRLSSDAADTLAQRRGTNAQTFRLYNTYTDSSNYERGYWRWTSNTLYIGEEKAGTGTGRIVEIRNSQNTFVRLNNGGVYTVQIGGISAPTLTIGYADGSNSGYATAGYCLANSHGNSSSGVGRFGPVTDTAAVGFSVFGAAAHSAATTNIVGGNVNVVAGAGASASAGAAHGGCVKLAGGAAYGTGTKGRVILDAPNAAPQDSFLSNGEITLYLDQAANKLMARVRYSDGTLKTGEVALT